MLKLFKKNIPKHKVPRTRKERSENRLASLGIEYNPHLPETIEFDLTKIRSSKKIASKIIATWEVINIATKSKDSDRIESIEFLKDIDLWNDLSLQEKEFLEKKKHSSQKIIDIQWKTETLKVLYWSLD